MSEDLDSSDDPFFTEADAEALIEHWDPPEERGDGFTDEELGEALIRLWERREEPLSWEEVAEALIERDRDRSKEAPR